MIEHVRRLAMGQSINRPVYDFTIHNRVDETVLVEPAKVIIVEGILIFENKELRDLCDIKVFIVTQYLTTVKPMHEQFVEPSKKFADLIIPEGGYNRVALDMLNEKIAALLKERA